jgi:arginyl-tRNA synthetase
MSTREGHYVLLDDILDEVGSDAIRYFMLAHSPDSRIDFDLDLARKQSNENPVFYIQNAHVRCASIARVAAERGIDHAEGDVSLLDHPLELALIRKMVQIPEIIALSISEMAPHKIAIWAHQEFASVFHQTYEEARALHDSVPPEIMKARLKLYAAARIAFARSLDLMGMSAPDHM